MLIPGSNTNHSTLGINFLCLGLLICKMETIAVFILWPTEPHPTWSLVASHPHLSHLTSSQPHWPSHHSLNTPITFPPSSLHTGHSLSRMIFLYPAAAKSLQSCPTLCDLIDGSPPGSSVPGILQARTLEWVAISFSNVLVSNTCQIFQPRMVYF